MAQAPDRIRRARPLLGTFVEIEAWGGDLKIAEEAVESAFTAIERVHRLMSFHDTRSDVCRLNSEAASTEVPVDAWTYEVLEAALDLHHRSQGIFDVAIAPALQKLGLLPSPSDFARPPIPARQGTHSGSGVTLLPGCRVCFERPDIAIDLGGIAKGFAVDRAVEALRCHGVPQGLVNAGGDLAAFGASPNTVHIRDPRSPARFLGTVQIHNRALASSGARFDLLQSTGSKGSAVIDPITQMPVRAVAGATVMAGSCMFADALTKIVMIAGEEAGSVLSHYCADALIVLNDGAAYGSSGWKELCLAA